MQAVRVSKGMFLVALMMLASLSGCFGEEEVVQEGVPIVFQVDYQMPEDVVMKSGEWHEFQLLGNGRAISVPTDVMLFIDCLLYTSPSPRDRSLSRMPSSA